MSLHIFWRNLVDFSNQGKKWGDKLFKIVVGVSFYSFFEDFKKTVCVNEGGVFREEFGAVFFCF